MNNAHGLEVASLHLWNHSYEIEVFLQKLKIKLIGGKSYSTPCSQQGYCLSVMEFRFRLTLWLNTWSYIRIAN